MKCIIISGILFHRKCFSGPNQGWASPSITAFRTVVINQIWRRLWKIYKTSLCLPNVHTVCSQFQRYFQSPLPHWTSGKDLLLYTNVPNVCLLIYFPSYLDFLFLWLWHLYFFCWSVTYIIFVKLLLFSHKACLSWELVMVFNCTYFLSLRKSTCSHLFFPLFSLF